MRSIFLSAEGVIQGALRVGYSSWGHIEHVAPAFKSSTRTMLTDFTQTFLKKIDRKIESCLSINPTAEDLLLIFQGFVAAFL